MTSPTVTETRRASAHNPALAIAASQINMVKAAQTYKLTGKLPSYVPRSNS